MKMVIIIVAVLALLGAGGYAAYTFLGAGEEPSAAAPEDGEKPAFIALDPFIVPVIRGNEIVRHVNLEITLELAPGVAEDDVNEMMTFLRDAFIKRLHGIIGRRHGRREDEGLDMARIKRGLLADSARVLGPDIVRDVLIQSSFERRVSP